GIVADPTLVALAADYLKVVPKLGILALWHSSYRFSDASAQGAQMYHFDLGFPRWINFFIYLSNVSSESGPHSYVKGTHRRDREGAHLRARGVQRIPDDDIFATYEREKLVEVSGPPGTMFMVDTRGWHKGIKPLKNDRLVFEVIYANSTYTQPVEDITAPAKSLILEDMFHNHPEMFFRFKPIIDPSAQP